MSPDAATLSVAEVERRLLRACKTIRALPDRERRFQVFTAMWPEVVRDVSEAYGYDDAIIPRFRPTPADVTDCLIALSWAQAVPKREWKLIWWRSFDISFRHIGLRLGRSDETARRRYRDALLNIWWFACGQNAAA